MKFKHHCPFGEWGWILGTVTPESKVLNPGAAVDSGVILASSPDFLECIELELMIC